ncbi:ATP-binding protein [Stenotrophomonas maltophilia]
MTWFSPYERKRRIGTVASCGPTEFVINLAGAAEGVTHAYFGRKLSAGLVGDLVFIELGEVALLCRIAKVWLEGSDRYSVEPGALPRGVPHPLGAAIPLATVRVEDGDVMRGVARFPELGSHVYSAHPDLVVHLYGGKDDQASGVVSLDIATLPQDTHVDVVISPESLFARHCCVLGATGGGKSFTVARMIEQIRSNGGKALLIDATGEYEQLDLYTGVFDQTTGGRRERMVFPHTDFMDSDLRALLRPSPQSQAPKLDAAIRSLKMVFHAKAGTAGADLPIDAEGNLLKSGQKKEPQQAYYTKYADEIDRSPWLFSALSKQIVHECVYPDANFGKDQSIWGGRVENDVGNCLNLISRVDQLAKSVHHRWLIDVDPSIKTVSSTLEAFAKSSGGIIRLDLSSIPFEGSSREVLVNALGRKLLALARAGYVTKKNPLIVVLDEAHQFLSKSLSFDAGQIVLDAFGAISKEGRKYGLTVVISTQRSRDIPDDVFSQIGTFVVHRLSNSYDRDAMEKALGDADSRITAMVPTLATGEALLGGVGFKFPMIVKIKPPASRLATEGADYSGAWQSVKE